MKNYLKIFRTNWINIIGVFCVALIYSFFKAYIVTTFSVFQALISALILVCLYGIIFWLGFLIVIAILDFVLLRNPLEKLKLKLLIEWIIISIPFIYWIVKYEEWIFVAIIVSFLFTQLLRERQILRKINN